MTHITDTCKTALLGMACGDCFGAPFEFNLKGAELAALSMNEGRYLSSWDDCDMRRPKWCRLPGLYTDDTQQALVLINAKLIGADPAETASYVLEVFRLMARAEIEKAPFGVHRGTGSNFREAVRTGKPVDTAGLGAAMRVGPVATLFQDPQEMVEWVIAVSAVTTSNPVSLACAAKFATIAWVLAYPDRRSEILKLDWPSEHIPSEVWRATTAALRIMKTEGENALLQFATMTGWSNKKLSNAANGFALTGFPWAVNQALTAKTFPEALVSVCSSGGDTDTVAAMAGCLAALKFGREKIPEWMTENLLNRDIIESPDDWHPVEDERDLTELDEEHRQEMRARQNEQMTDTEFLGYVERHCRTPRALFSWEHIKRLYELAGRTCEWDGKPPMFSAMWEEEALPLVELARKEQHQPR